MVNRITELLNIKYPIIQAGMVWCSGWRLASAVSNKGGLGLLGAGSMHPETLLEHIQKMKLATQASWGVNVPLLYPQIEEIMEIIISEKVPIVFTSAGSPKTWTQKLQSHGIKVVHVVSSTKFALKCEEANCDAIVVEGFEAGGHNGREETTSLILLQQTAQVCSLPIIAAGGFATGQSMVAAFALGAEAIQVGSRFAVTEESSAHLKFKEAVCNAHEGDTMLALKQLTPVRLLKNPFFDQVYTAQIKGATTQELQTLLGSRRAKHGIFEGDMEEGELEIGQISSILNRIETVSEVMDDLVRNFNHTIGRICLLEM